MSCTLVDVLGDALVDLKIVLFIELDLIGIENVQSTPKGPDRPCKNVALGVSFVAMGHSRNSKNRKSQFPEHYKIVKIKYDANLGNFAFIFLAIGQES